MRSCNRHSALLPVPDELHCHMYICTPEKAQLCLLLMSHALLARDLVVRCDEVGLLLADARVALQGKPMMSASLGAAVCLP